MNLTEVRERLEGSRAALLAALEGVTERNFAAELEPGTTIVATLAALAPAEREAIRQARLAVGAPERALPATGANVSSRATPPQVVHDLAGARYETSLFLELLGSLEVDSTPDDLATLLEGIYEREIAVAEAVQSRIGAERPDSA
jgi:hypothetical protein